MAQFWGGRWVSNPRPPESQSGALPTELRPPLTVKLSCEATLPAEWPSYLARPAGLEPATLGLAYPLRLSTPPAEQEFGVWTISSPSQVPHV
jgi:hypothetical protein